MAIFNSLVICVFLNDLLPMRFKTYGPVVRVVTDWNVSVEELAEIGERIFNLQRMFNIREGINRKDDTLPKRLLETPLEEGPAKGFTVKLDEMLEEYYEVRGWSEAGIPTEQRLKELGLSYVTKDVTSLE